MRYKHQYLLDFENPTEANEAIARAYVKGYAVLVKTALDRATIRFDKVQRMLEKELHDLSGETVSRIIKSASSRSWLEYRCVIGSLVLSRNRMPGRPMFEQARNLGAITSIPKTEDELRAVARQLQEKCYEAIKNTNNCQQ